MAQSTNVQKFYQTIIDDVINDVQEAFIDEGYDERTLGDLKKLWEKKLAETKATERRPDPLLPRVGVPQFGVHRVQPQSVRVTPVRHDSLAAGDSRGSAVPANFAFTIPARMAQDGLQKLLTTSNVQFAQLLRNGAPQSSPVQQMPGVQYQVLTPQQLQNLPQFTVTVPSTPTRPKQTSDIIQLDGNNDDTSDDDDSLGSFSDDDVDDEDLREDDGIQEEPLNSGDDESDDGLEDFDIDDVVVCQYEKVHRTKNRWKFNLKSGIMSVRGKDFVFLKAMGESEW